jgi:hypothetical protein
MLRRLSGGWTVLLHDSDEFAAPRSWDATLAALPASSPPAMPAAGRSAHWVTIFGRRRRFSASSARQA